MHRISTLRSLARSTLSGVSSRRTLATAATRGNFVKIVEVSPRDGLQNEKTIVPTATKIELIRRLAETGVPVIEAGSFVSPKWVPQMGDTPQVVSGMPVSPSISYPVLVPNMRGLEGLQKLLETHKGQTDEIAIFTAASESFCKANTNCSIAESLTRLEEVTAKAKAMGLKVRGYVSVVAGCPYEGAVDPEAVGRVSKALKDMGCYEVSLGDTIGAGTPSVVEAALNASLKHTNAPAEYFAAHCHDTMNTGLANVLHMVRLGVRTVDAAVGGLGGCPYSPGATGNIDTESVVFALHAEGYETGTDLNKLVDVGEWISGEIGRRNMSNAGRAMLAQRKLKADKAAKEGKQRL
ncbi:Pyruvate carboxyltransferase [Kalmanozyma brasiliensis GHG001]|uniref:hydroxymethylglutaryl-CoA lyase n=1 Tax=Kalmanozyma brasiliensis (strain GHG001) TaxID=1365824 RepID=V5ES09_KALBG|nr:Pyruvate carboxyltransferase [Kalmanozyma brasiliensis GHG001]EST07945.1 Pyruvate carboxyltransferase [Kalmanozyma brasiliensis GHG001]